jgi:hypothetical protein
MLFKFVAGNNLKSALKKSNNLLLKNNIPIINYVSEDCKINNEKIVFNEYNNLINNINNKYILALKLSSLNFNKNYINDIALKCN